MSGRVVHFEVPFDDAERAKGFYQEAFGWDIMSMPEMQYNLVSSGPTDMQTGPTEPGFINGGMFARGVNRGDVAGARHRRPGDRPRA
ncbi:hypothetical protein [Kibdelosporangium philippinense]|uniref:hypothetical protein n=1 Tax=Kibdelosporangium philippinense TaxID=211113 RepID=UPI003623A282